MSTMPNVHILYHGNCFDGFGAAWIAQRFFNNPVLVPCSYGDPLPDIKDTDVYLLDFSFPREQLLQLKAQNRFLKVIDHHKTAQAICEGLDFCEFDMNRSGAGMTWDYFHNHVPRPTLIRVVEDRDLWRFQVSKCKELHAYIASYPKDVKTWDKLHDDLEYEYLQCVLEGQAILRYHAQKSEEIAAFVSLQQIGGYTVPVVNCPYNFASDVLHGIIEKDSKAPFVASYFYRADGTKQFSLRGRDTDSFDVSEVAKMYGGGGHPKSSGFSIAPDHTQ